MPNGLLARFLILMVAVLTTSSSHAATKCLLGRAAELPVTMRGLSPTIATKINGKDAEFLLDSGAFFTSVTAAAANEFDLLIRKAPNGFYIVGMGGAFTPQIGRAKQFFIADATFDDFDFFVGGSEPGVSVGLLGQNLLENFDVEYDLGNGVVRLFRTDGCDESNLAYWLKKDQPYSSMAIDKMNRKNAHTVGVGFVNGQKIRIAFDTGATYSILSSAAAAKAGVKLDSDGVTAAGYSTGVGSGAVMSYIARFDTFQVGDGEQIQNAKLRIANINFQFADMLLGADFFMSHRVFVANREHKLFLSYNGGPVFDLTSHEGSGSEAKTADAAAPATGLNAEAGAADAAELARKGSALAARQKFGPGLAALSKAIELSPAEPEFYYQRGNAYWADNQPDLALADFDEVVALKENFLPAYVPRAEIRLQKGDTAQALASLDRVDSLAPMQADLRFAMGLVYDRMDHTPQAIRELGLWITGHPNDPRMVSALGVRCFAQALQNEGLSEAAMECDEALARCYQSDPNCGLLSLDRALVRIREAQYDKAIADCNDALKRLPNNALALYVRAVAESRENMKSESDADLAAAQKIDSKVGERLQRYAILP